MCKYRVIGRCMNGVHAVGYVLQSLNSQQNSIVAKSVVDELALNRSIVNVTGQVYDGKVFLKGVKCKLIDLPNCTVDGKIITKDARSIEDKNTWNIIARIVNGKNIVGYRVAGVSTSGIEVEKNLSRDTIITLAKGGQIKNARVQMSNGKTLLRGNGCELAQLPSIRMNVHQTVNA